MARPDRAATLLRVVLAVIGRVWVLLAALAAAATASGAWWVGTGDPSLLRLAADLATIVLLGLIGSFCLHESAHLLVLRRLTSVDHVMLETTRWRISLRPVGAMTRRQVGIVAVAGPGACVGFGVVLRVVAPDAGLSWWYLAHGVALLPMFGDGRALLLAALSAGTSSRGTRDA